MTSRGILDTPLTLDDTKISLRSPNHGDKEVLNTIFTSRYIIETDPGNEIWEGSEGQFVDVVRERAELEPPTLAIFLIISKEHNNEVLGLTGFSQIVKEEFWGLVGHIGIQVLPEFARKGVGTKAVIISINYGFSNLGMDIIIIATFDNNEGVKTIIRKLKTEGIWKPEKEEKSFWYKTLATGKVDILYRISRIDWKQK